MAGLVHSHAMVLNPQAKHICFANSLRIGLCVTKSFVAFCAISFITSVTTVTPQLMLPLVGDLAPPHRRSTALSIVVSGMLLGMLIARLLSGVVTEFIGWRYVYWIAFGLQYLIFILLFLFMPDYPSTNPDMGVVRKYPGLLLDILRMPFKHPVLVQACLIGFFTASIFTSYWTTLTFLLAGSPYYYSSLVIGLFALVGIASMTWGPIFARTVMEKHEPLFSILIGEAICLAGAIIGTYTGLHTVAGPIIQAACIDIGLQTSQIANRTAIFGIEPKARNRVNTAYMVSVFCGQLTGTAAGNHLYAQGGWIKSGSASVGFICSALVICLLRGPHEQGWIGWGGGCKMRKASVVIQPQTDEEMGAEGKHTQQLLAILQTRTENKRDDVDREVGLKTSGHSVSGSASEKTLTILEDNTSGMNGEK
jgi:predicted MFS family arabinose efflux permease